MASLINKAKEMAGLNGENQTQATETHHAQTNSTHAPTQTHSQTHSQTPAFQENVFQDTTKTGPVHNNEMLNKADPRVHEQHTRSTEPRVDPQNAAHVPPSVMQQHLGEPTIEHDYPQDSTTKRHSVSHQEAHILG